MLGRLLVVDEHRGPRVVPAARGKTVVRVVHLAVDRYLRHAVGRAAGRFLVDEQEIFARQGHRERLVRGAFGLVPVGGKGLSAPVVDEVAEVFVGAGKGAGRDLDALRDGRRVDHPDADEAVADGGLVRERDFRRDGFRVDRVVVMAHARGHQLVAPVAGMVDIREESVLRDAFRLEFAHERVLHADHRQAVQRADSKVPLSRFPLQRSVTQ